MRILIAEDERITRHILQRQLEQMGHEVVSAADGQEAWEQFQADPPPIVICDWEMPRVDGVELVRRIRATDTAGYVYVIILTGKSAKQDIVVGMEAGADDFITKPFDRNELRVRLNAGQRIIQLERELAEHNTMLSHANARMSRDLDAAARVQQSLLPTTSPKTSRVSFAWQYLPCDELAGDFLNFFELDDNHIAIYVVDVSGHGVASSLLSVTIGRLLTPHISTSSLLIQQVDGTGETRVVPPAEVAGELNRRFPMADQNELYFTMLYGVLDLRTLEFCYVSAGHEPVVHVAGNKTPRLLKRHGFAIGWFEDVEYEEQVIKLQPGDRVYLYSDGVPEAMNEDLSPFTENKMLDTIERANSQSLQDSVLVLLESVKHWSAQNGPKDDVSILAVEIRN